MSSLTLAIVKHIAGGAAFFSGVTLMLLAALCRRGNWWGSERIVFLLWTVAAALIVLSATPLPTVYSLCAAVISIAWLALGRHRPASSPALEPTPDTSAVPANRVKPSLAILTWLFCLCWLLGGLVEFTFHTFNPRLSHATAQRLTIFGDSVTAGMEENEATTWPKLFRERHDVEVVDLSHVGATVASAAKQARGQEIMPGIVLLEIGGNDLLGPTSVEVFERGLDDLLKQVSGDHRQVLMFELPLPPLSNRFGQVQRRLASKHNVKLIPRRIFIDVLLSPETTLDSIHLNQQGHEKMANVVWELVRDAFE